MAKESTKKPKMGEQTGKQTPAIDAMVIGMLGGAFDFGDVPPARFDTYRKMRNNPTIALGRAIANAPLRTAKWSLETDDKDVPEKMVDFINEQIEYLWPGLIENLLLAKDYGFQSFEKVWDIKDGKLIIRKMKPLLSDETRIIIRQDNGAFNGLRQGPVDLGPEQCFLYSYDMDVGKWYGRSHFENIREHAWHPWNEIAQRELKYASKVAGVIPVIKYQPGTGKDKTGREYSNYELAFTALNKLGQGNGVAIPMELVPWGEDLIRQGVNPEQLLSWQVSFLETKGQHAVGFVSMLRHYESLMLRGLFVPERIATEGQHGTKAEAGTHADIALTLADLSFQDIIRAISWHVINPLIVYNFGHKYENKIRLTRAGLDPELNRFFREVISKVLTSPTNVDLFQLWLDVDSMLDKVGLPKAEEEVEKPAVDKDPNQPIPPQLQDPDNPQPPQVPKAPMTAAMSRIYGDLYGRFERN